MPFWIPAMAVGALLYGGSKFLDSSREQTEAMTDLGKIAIGAGAVYLSYRALKASGALK